MESFGKACGKIILLGEHAVVYGVPALVAGLDRGARAVVRDAEVDAIGFGERILPPDHELHRALAALRAALGAAPVKLGLELDLPAGSGLGASAALGVATARALALHVGRALDEDEMLDAVAAWERVFHGNPSGVDAAAALRGGTIRFVRGSSPEPIPLAGSLVVVVAVAGPPAPTKEMVDGVARLRGERPENFEKSLRGIESLVENATLCLRAGDRRGLGKLLDLNQMLLAGWLLSTPEIEHACAVARASGALGAKLTGSGGGGCIVALSNGDPEPILRALGDEGFTAFAAEIGGERRGQT